MDLVGLTCQLEEKPWWTQAVVFLEIFKIPANSKTVSLTNQDLILLECLSISGTNAKWKDEGKKGFSLPSHVTIPAE